jgi:hypothetical protein
MKWLLLVPLLCASAFATDIYFGPTSSGSNNGTSCSSAYAYNDGTHGWSQSAQQAAGNNLHICSGTYTVTTGGQVLTTANSGSSGNPITFIADQGGATFQSPVFSSSGALAISNAYWVINGDNNLTIQNTANGTGLANNTQSGAFYISASNVTVENMTVQNLCQRSAGDTGDSCTNGGNDSTGIEVTGSLSNITLQSITEAEGGHNCIFMSLGSSSSGILISKNTLSGCNWEIGSNSPSAGVTITGNDITCVAAALCNWDDPADDNHHNGIYFFPGSGAATNVVISNNYIHDINGNTTGYIFFTDQNGGPITGAEIYNNIFFTTSSQSGPGNGFVTSGVTGNTGLLVLNNTFYGPGQRSISDDQGSTNENNIVVNGTCQEYFDSGQSAIVAAYNDFYQSGTPQCQSSGQNWFNGTTGFTTLAAWQAGTTGQCSGGCDVTGSITSNPNLNTNFTIPSGSPVIAAGANLTSLGIAGLDIGAPQYFGVSYACGTGCTSRASSGGWDMGAYPYTGAQAVSPSCSPTSGDAPQSLTCLNPNGSPRVMCEALSPTTPVTNTLGTGCSTGTSLGTASSEPYSVSSAGTYNFVAGTASLSDSPVSSYTYLAPGGSIATSNTKRTANTIQQ